MQGVTIQQAYNIAQFLHVMFAGIERRARRRKTELAARPPFSPLLPFPGSRQFREPTPTQLAAEPERLPPSGQSPSSPQPVTRKFCVIKHDI